MYLGRVIREFHAEAALLPGDPSSVQRDFFGGFGAPTVPVMAWRFWHIVRAEEPEGWFLASASAPYLWEAPAVWDAYPPASAPPGSDAGRVRPSGFHGFKHRFQALRWAHVIRSENAHRSGRWYRESRRVVPGVWGSCELAGHVVEHELGYRAQGMAIRGLRVVVAERIDVEWLRRMVLELERRYACDVQGWERGGEAFATATQSPTPKGKRYLGTQSSTRQSTS